MFSRALPVHSLGGMEVNSLETAKQLSLIGHHVALLTTAHPNHPAEDWTEIEGRLQVLYLGHTPCGRYSEAFDDRLRDHLACVLPRRAIEVLHSHNSSAANAIRPYDLRHLRIPHIVTWHGIHSQWIFDSLAAAVRGHNTASRLREAFVDLRRWLSRDIRLSATADRIIAQDAHMAKLIRWHFPVDKRRIVEIGLGVDTGRFQPARFQPEPETFRILALGRLEPQKGFADIIEAVALLRNKVGELRLEIVGDGSGRNVLEQLVARRGLRDRVVFCGYKSREALPVVYNQCQLFVNASTHDDGYNTVILEAMACGLPVVSTATKGACEVITDGIDGQLVPKSRPDAIATAIYALHRDPVGRGKLSCQARATAVQRFSSANMAANLTSVYREAIAKV